MSDPIPPYIADLLTVYTPEQLQQFADKSKKMQALAIERGCYQTITIPFSAKGYPGHFNGTDNEKAILPDYYKAE